jgi:hypothetical protein
MVEQHVILWGFTQTTFFFANHQQVTKESLIKKGGNYNNISKPNIMDANNGSHHHH